MMTVFLVTYGLLWVAVFMLAFVLLGVLRQLGNTTRRGYATAESRAPADDGPDIGAQVPEMILEPGNDYGMISLRDFASEGGVLIAFLTPSCEGCQAVAESLSTLVAGDSYGVPALVVLSGRPDSNRAFLAAFKLEMRVIFDETLDMMRAFGVHTWPYGLLYDTRGTLVCKSVLDGRDGVVSMLEQQASTALVH